MHRSLLPNSRLVMHLPDSDTLAMYDIYVVMMTKARGWVDG